MDLADIFGEVLKPVPVQSGQVAPALDQIGGVTQMISPVNLKTLLDKGILGRSSGEI